MKVTLKMPSDPMPIQIRNRSIWNDKRPYEAAEFFTIGYAGRTPEDFVEALNRAGVHTLIDARMTPVSRFRPQFSKENLRRLLVEHGVDYLHRPDLGVPGDVRGLAVGTDSRAAIWEWYDRHVIPWYASQNLSDFFNTTIHPVAFMCVETDPTACHRHRLALALERVGLHCHDL